MINNIFFDIGLIVIIVTVLAFITKLLKQPLIPAYVLTGLLLGPILQIVTNKEIITTLSEIGIAFLLFIVGLEIDLQKLRNVGFVASLGGLIKSLLIFTIGFIVMLVLGFKNIEALYIGMIMVFSSTMIVVKILSDRRELDTLHGRIIVGYLLLEDILAILVLSVLNNAEALNFQLFSLSFFKAILIFAAVRFSGKYLFPPLFRFAAKSQELLFLAAVSVCFLFSILLASLGFSVSVGAFLGGVALAGLPYSYEIIGKVKSIRDFFATIFFVSLGMSIVAVSQNQIFAVLVIIIIVLLIKPIITIFTTSFFGYKKRISFLSGIALCQISEFSLILATQGMILGHISVEILSITAIIAVVSMTATSYIFNYEYWLYQRLGKLLSKFEIFSTNAELEYKKDSDCDVLVVGYDRIGYSIVKKLRLLKKRLLVIDYNPEVIKKLMGEKVNCIYGDISDEEIMEKVNLNQISMIISTCPDKRDNELLILKAKEINKNLIVFATAYAVQDALELYDIGADYVILPHFLGGDHVSLLIEKMGNDAVKLIKNKFIHIEDLKKRESLGHVHPTTHQGE